MWRLDRADDPVPLDNLWGQTVDEAVADLQAAANPMAGAPDVRAEVELAVGPYLPHTIRSVPVSLRDVAIHYGGPQPQWKPRWA